jgi:hypothetical protein
VYLAWFRLDMEDLEILELEEAQHLANPEHHGEPHQHEGHQHEEGTKLKELNGATQR